MMGLFVIIYSMMFAYLMVVLGLVYVLGACTSNKHYVLITLLYGVLAALCFCSAGLLAIGATIAGEILGWANLIVAFSLVIALFYVARGAHLHPEQQKLDWIVVLGCKLIDGKPGRALRGRCRAAAACLERHPEAQLMVCGGRGNDEPLTEAQAMEDYLLQLGVAPHVINQENTSTTTAENFSNFLELSNAQNAAVAVVTSDFHMRRALQLAKRQGLENACGVPSRTYSYKWINGALREILCLAADRLGINGHDLRIGGKRL